MTVTRRPTRPSPRPQPREVDPEFTELVDAWLRDSPAPEVELEPEVDESEETPAARDDVPSRISIGLVGTLAFIFVFGALFGLAAFHSVLVQNQLRIDRLSRDVEREQTRYQELRIEHGQAAAPFRVLAQAGARGMLQSKSKEPLQAVLPEQGALSAPNSHPFGKVSNFVPPIVSAPPPQTTTAPTTIPPASTVPTASTISPATTIPPASTGSHGEHRSDHDDESGPMTAGTYGNGRDRGTGVHRLAVPMALSRRRLVAMLVATMVIATCLTARLATLQVTPPDRLIEFSESRASRVVDLVAPRGAIVDHYDRDLVLTTQAKTVAVDPMLIPDIPLAAFQLASIFSMGTTDLEQRLLTARDGKKHFAYISRQVTEAQAAQALGLGIEGLFTIEEPKRIKPSGALVGASVLGSTDIDNNGQSGLEKQYDAILSGKKGKLIVEEGTKGRTIPGGVRTGVSAVSGNTLVLSLDRPLQFEVDQLLQQAVDRYGAQYGVAIVSRIGTSEILANSVVHRVDGKPAEPTTENRAVTWGWEPGSIMKAITISALIDSGTVDIDSEFLVPASIDVHDVTYTDDHLHPTEMMTAEKIIQDSSNVGTIKMTQELGEAKLHQYLTNFGLGAPTGLGFPGESAGYVGNYGRWDGTTLSSYAIGQSVIVTPMQMLMALNTVANDGLYVAPRYVLGRQTGDGKFIPEPAPEQRQVISPESAAKVNQSAPVGRRRGYRHRGATRGLRRRGQDGHRVEGAESAPSVRRLPRPERASATCRRRSWDTCRRKTRRSRSW